MCKFLNLIYSGNNIVETFGWTCDHTNGTYYCVYEYLQGDTVSSIISKNRVYKMYLDSFKMTEWYTAYKYVTKKQVLIQKNNIIDLNKIIKKLKKHTRFIHGGIHGNNIILSNDRFVLFDFSKSSILYDGVTLYGRCFYGDMDVEQLNSTFFDYKYFNTQLIEILLK